MPSYEYRCQNCGRPVTYTYKTYKEFDEAQRACPHCGSADLTRLISRVAIARPSRTYSNMSSTEMLSVMEGGDSREMGEMFRQVGETVPGGMDAQFTETTERLLKGDKPDRIEADLQANNTPPSTSSDS